jgi:hypothetical protein
MSPPSRARWFPHVPHQIPQSVRAGPGTPLPDRGRWGVALHDVRRASGECQLTDSHSATAGVSLKMSMLLIRGGASWSW